MIVLGILEGIFNILLPISIIISSIIGMKKMFAGSSQENAESNVSEQKGNADWKDNVKVIIKISTIVVFIIGVVLVVVNIKKLYWLIIFIGVPAYLERIVGTYRSFGIVERVVKSSDNGKLSFKEQTAIKTLAYALWFLGISKIFENVIEKICAYPNAYLSDMFVAFCYVLIFYLYIFFICALLPELISSAIILIKKINAILPWKGNEPTPKS